MSRLRLIDRAIAAAKDLVKYLLHPTAKFTIDPICEDHQLALYQLTTIFRNHYNNAPVISPLPGFPTLPRVVRYTKLITNHTAHPRVVPLSPTPIPMSRVIDLIITPAPIPRVIVTAPTYVAPTHSLQPPTTNNASITCSSRQHDTHPDGFPGDLPQQSDPQLHARNNNINFKIAQQLAEDML